MKSTKNGRLSRINFKAKAPASRQKPPVTQEQPSARREAEQVPAKPDGQDDDFEIFDL